jgi:hypothetical protein
MGGNTGNIRTYRLSSSNGTRTLGSLLSDASSAGAGSTRRMYAYYTRNGNVTGFYQNVLNLRYGEYSNRTQWFLKQL